MPLCCVKRQMPFTVKRIPEPIRKLFCFIFLLKGVPFDICYRPIVLLSKWGGMQVSKLKILWVKILEKSPKITPIFAIEKSRAPKIELVISSGRS